MGHEPHQPAHTKGEVGRRPQDEPTPSPDVRPGDEILLQRVARLEEKQQQLLLDRERLLALLNSLPEDVFFVDADGNVVLVNEAVRAHLGITETDDLRRQLAETESMFEVYAPDGLRRRPEESPFLRALKGEPVRGEEVVRNLATGELRHRRYSVAPVWLAGEIVGAASSVRDVTAEKQATEALRQSEQKFSAIFGHAPLPMALTAVPNGEIVDLNDAFVALFGYRRDEAVGKTALELGLFDDPGPRREVVVETEEQSTIRDRELVFRCRSGERRHCSLSSTVISVAGRPHFLAAIQDITERKRVEEELRRSRERTARQNAVLSGIARIFGEALDCETEEQLGRACLQVAEEITGSRFGFLAEINERTGRLDGLAISDPGWDACRMEGSARGRPPVGFEIRGLYGRVIEEGRSLFTNDPSSHPASVGTPPGHPRVTSFLGVPLAQAGRPIGMIAVGNREGGYRTNEVEALEALAPAVVQALVGLRSRGAMRRNEARLGLLSRTAARLLGAEDPQGIVEELCREVMEHLDCQLFVNFLAERGAPRLRLNACAGVPPRDVGAIATLGFGQAICGRVARDRRRIVAEDVQAHPEDRRTGLLRPWGVQAYCCHPLMTGERLLGTLSFGTTTRTGFRADEIELMRVVADQVATAMERVDASRELGRVNARLLEEDRRKSEFLAVLSHELRNPLAPIRNSLYVLERAAPGGDQALRATTIIARQVEQLTRLVDDLLDVTRIGRNKVQLQRERLELNELVRRTLEDHRAELESAGLAIEFAPAPAPVHVDADWNRLAQVVGNLLQNAGKFTARGGHVRAGVETDPDADRAAIRIADSGVGIAPELLDRVFEPFAQADTSLDRAKGGLGLGLSLVKGLVDLHGGEVEARSAGPGRGSEFVVRLPLAASPSRAAEAAPVPPPARARRILVIEDNADAATSLAEVLRLIGHEVEIAPDGAEGIERARALRPDVVLCDIGLPTLDGYQVARTLRDDPALAGACRVALTGYALPEDLQRAAEAGFQHHLAKPPSLESLERLLADLPAASPAPPAS